MLLPPYGLDWMFVHVMCAFLRACKRSLLLSVVPFEPNPSIKPSCELMLSFAYPFTLLCSSSCPILCLNLTVASTGRKSMNQEHIVSLFCVRRCLLFTVTTHVQPPLQCIREEKSARRWSSHRTFVEYLSPIPLLHHTLCSNDTKIQNMNIGCTVGHGGHIIRRTSCKIYKLSPFHCTRTHAVSRRVGQVGADGTETFATSLS